MERPMRKMLPPSTESAKIKYRFDRERVKKNLW